MQVKSEKDTPDGITLDTTLYDDGTYALLDSCGLTSAPASMILLYSHGTGRRTAWRLPPRKYGGRGRALPPMRHPVRVSGTSPQEGETGQASADVTDAAPGRTVSVW
ncbi:MAG: hypothetical protein ACLUOF_03835 [Ruminococcus sp.]